MGLALKSPDDVVAGAADRRVVAGWALWVER